MFEFPLWPGPVIVAVVIVAILVTVVAALVAQGLVRRRQASLPNPFPEGTYGHSSTDSSSGIRDLVRESSTKPPARPSRPRIPDDPAARRHLSQLARTEFQQRREWLEARFYTLAATSGKPRGLAWVECEFDSQVTWARDRETGAPRALVGITIRFEAIPGGGMENNPNVGNPRAGTAVFQWEDDQWQTVGRALFNLNPTQAIEHFQHELEAENC